jgi:hypothetical protein
MNDGQNRWWTAGLVGLIVGVALTLVIAQTPYAEGGAGLLGLVFFGICIIVLVLVIAAVWPGLTLRTRDNLETAPGKTFMVGLVNYIFLGAIALVSLNLGPVAVIGIVLGGILLIGTFLGLPAVASLVGARLYALRKRETTRWGEVIYGSVALYLAILAPVVGWFIVLPALCLWSFGAAALTLVSRRKTNAMESEQYDVS